MDLGGATSAWRLHDDLLRALGMIGFGLDKARVAAAPANIGVPGTLGRDQGSDELTAWAAWLSTRRRAAAL